jgi:uncharacterized protein YndB with AHSA1/START domain
MTLTIDPDLDLSLSRVMRASLATVWNAWTNPDDLAQWWLPAPTRCRVDKLEAVPGGSFVTSMSDDGVSFTPHLDACFVVVEAETRLVFTNALDSRWRPSDPEPIAMTAEVTLRDHPEGTNYRVVVRHADARARDRHANLGFSDGWGTVTDQLAVLVESRGDER